MTKQDPKNIGVPNICFSLTDSDDKREPEYTQQRLERGFDDSETWSLSGTLASFLLPRLERFIELDSQMTVRDEQWNTDVASFKRLLELEERDSGGRMWSVKEEKEVEKGLKAFEKIFLGLWW